MAISIKKKKTESVESNDRLHLEWTEHKNIKSFKNIKELLSFSSFVSTESKYKLTRTGLELTISMSPYDSSLWIKALVRQFGVIVIMSSILGPSSVYFNSVEMGVQ